MTVRQAIVSVSRCLFPLMARAGRALAIALMVVAVAVTSTGWANYNELGGDWLEETHEVLANLMLLIDWRDSSHAIIRW